MALTGLNLATLVMSCVAAVGFIGWPLYTWKINHGLTTTEATVRYVCGCSVLTGIFTASVGCYAFYYGLGIGQKAGKFNASMLMISIYMVLFGILVSVRYGAPTLSRRAYALPSHHKQYAPRNKTGGRVWDANNVS